MAATVNPYLTFRDKTEAAFNFYKSVFGGEFAMIMRFGDTPAEHPMSESDKNKIMHVALPLGNGTVLMGSDTGEGMDDVTMGTNFSISISTDSEAEATKIFNALSAGGQATMPMNKTFWGSWFGMLTDKFGIQWMVSYDYNRGGK